MVIASTVHLIVQMCFYKTTERTAAHMGKQYPFRSLISTGVLLMAVMVHIRKVTTLLHVSRRSLSYGSGVAEFETAQISSSHTFLIQSLESTGCLLHTSAPFSHQRIYMCTLTSQRK